MSTRTAFALVLLLAAPAAFAEPGYTTTTVNLRAGPDTDYPVLGVLPPGLPVEIEGCVDGWSWCDVSVDGDRGWIAGSFLEYEYDQRRVVLSRYGRHSDIPIVTFSLGSYWDTHYRGHYDWYRDRARWANWHHGYAPPAVYHVAPRYYGGRAYHHGDDRRYDRHDEHRYDRRDGRYDGHDRGHGRDRDGDHDGHRDDHRDRDHDGHRDHH
jgi:uncharacterized protein YraI